MIKTLHNVDINGTYLNIIKVMYDKPTANIILSREKLSISTEISNKTRMPTLATFIQHSIVFARANRQGKKRKGIQIGRDEVKLSLFADDMILFIDNPKDATKKTVRTNKQIQ